MNATPPRGGGCIHFVVRAGCIESALVGWGCILSALRRDGGKSLLVKDRTISQPPWGLPVAFNLPRLSRIISVPGQFRQGEQGKHNDKRKEAHGRHQAVPHPIRPRGRRVRKGNREGDRRQPDDGHARDHQAHLRVLQGLLRALQPVRPPAGLQAHAGLQGLHGQGRALRGVQLPQLQQVLRQGRVHRLLRQARQDRAGLQRLPRHEELPQAQARLRRQPRVRRLPQDG